MNDWQRKLIINHKNIDAANYCQSGKTSADCTPVCFFYVTLLKLTAMAIKFDFYKEKRTDKVFWVDNLDNIGEHLFSFDKKKIYNLFADYPHNLSPKERKIFDKENPYWVDFFKDRQ